MDSLLEKLNKWKMLRKEYAALRQRKEKTRIAREVEDVRRSKDIPRLRSLLARDAEACGDLGGFLIQEFKRSIGFNSRERVSSIIECMCLLKMEPTDAREMLVNHLQSIYSKSTRASVSARLAALVGLQEYDLTDGLGTSEYIRKRMNEEMDVYTRNVPCSAPRELDGWLTEAARVAEYRPEIMDMYRDLEMRYFSMCLGLVRMDGEGFVEDAAYLINKVYRRSRTVGIDLAADIRRISQEHGILDGEESKGFLRSTFPFLR